MTGPRYTLYRSQDHLAQLHESGLTDETIELAELYTEHDLKTIRRLLNWSSAPGRDAHQFGPSLVFPCKEYDTGKVYAYRVRPDNPRAERKAEKDKVSKYESPAKCGIVVYYPPRTRAQHRLRLPGAKIIVEGEKKALLLDQLGWGVIGITGVNNWHDSKVRNPEGQPKGSGPYVLNPRISQFLDMRDCDLVIVFDSDARESDDIMKAAAQLAMTAYAAGAKSVRLVMPPSGPNGEKMGIDDYFVFVESNGGNGADVVSKMINDAPLMDLSKQDRRVRVVLATDEHRSTDEAVKAVVQAPEIFVREFQLVRVVYSLERETKDNVTRPVGAPSIRALSLPTLREILTREARFVELDDEGNEHPKHPPRWVVDALAARGQWEGMRPIVGVIDSPILRPDGTVLARSGYDAVSRVLVHLDDSLEGLDLSNAPTRAEAKAAAHELLGLVSDFPFATKADRAAWLAFVVTGFAREAYDGPTPLHLINAAVKGTGKTKLAKVAAIIISGREPGEAGYVCDSAEMAKRITSIALQGDRVVLLDNIEGPFGDASTNRALTSTLWRERLLHKNEQPALPLRWLPVGTANNADVADDMTRRVVPIRLLAQVEKPEERTGFQIADLEGHTRANRAKYVKAALTILRAFIVAGRPQANLERLGSFEGWRDLVAGAVLFAYGTDPLLSRKSASSSVRDARLVALRALLEAMLDKQASADEHRRRKGMPTHIEALGLRSREILGQMQLAEDAADNVPVVSELWKVARDSLSALVHRRSGEPVSPHSLGKSLQQHVDRVVQLQRRGLEQEDVPEGSTVEAAFVLVKLVSYTKRNSQVWCVEHVAAQGTEPGPVDTPSRGAAQAHGPGMSGCRDGRDVEYQEDVSVVTLSTQIEKVETEANDATNPTSRHGGAPNGEAADDEEEARDVLVYRKAAE